MKAIVLIISLAVFQVTSLFGSNIGKPFKGSSSTETFCIECAFLTPVVPLQATYEDSKEVKSILAEEFLMPEVPMVADFQSAL
ncbi:MAG: hypothetical protein IH596_09060 [Bacteroidales bacterium]|nr:hypothetical protein [Bacteroidales bacterium]